MNCSATDASRETEVFTLLVVVGRWPNDELPADATGAELLCYATGCDEAEAVRETVNVLRAAELRPLDVTGYGSLAEREADGEVGEEERGLIERCRRENAVIVAELTPTYGDGSPQ
ncbi:MAG: hypothetical protein QM699_08515 [Amaricoccus sp.]|uniref:hypothetical protein n=1 Tax=Amaricoccus sp. TaxID=1872485 RepID=UPI0039E62A12